MSDDTSVKETLLDDPQNEPKEDTENKSDYQAVPKEDLKEKQKPTSDNEQLLKKLKDVNIGSIDENGNNVITRDELTKFFTKADIRIDIADIVFDIIDVNHDDSISAKEYFQWHDKLDISLITEIVAKADKKKEAKQQKKKKEVAAKKQKEEEKNKEKEKEKVIISKDEENKENKLEKEVKKVDGKDKDKKKVNEKDSKLSTNKNKNKKKRESFISPADIEAYPKGRRMSALEVNDMKTNIEQMTAALIADPKKAQRRYTKDIQEQKKKNKQQANDPNLFPDFAFDHKSVDNIPEETDERKEDGIQNEIKKNAIDLKLPPLTFGQIMLGLGPVWFLLTITLFALIIWSIANYPDEELYIAAPNGLWPNYGGNLKNQQRAPIDSTITSSNIDDLTYLCKYEQEYPKGYASESGSLGKGMSGFVAVDDNDNGIFVDSSGYVTSIDLDSCDINWKVYIANATGRSDDDGHLVSRNGLSLYMDSYGRTGVLVGGPNYGSTNEWCYIFSLDQSTGDVLWSIDIRANGSPSCKLDGFIVSGHYGYGGLVATNCSSRSNCTYRGEFIKIDLDEDGEVVDRWYSVPMRYKSIEYNMTVLVDGVNTTQLMNESILDVDNRYIGGAPLGFASFIGEYFIIGTGPLFGNPDTVNQCLQDADNNVTLYDGTNICNDSMSAYSHWRCYEDDVYSDSINIFQETEDSALQHIKSIPLQGNDLFIKYECDLYNDSISTETCGSDDTSILGAGNGAMAQASFTHDDMNYTAFLTTSGMFYVVGIPDGNLLFAKQIGHGASSGGGLYSLAIDESTMFAIISMNGMSNTRNQMFDSEYYCSTGWIEAIDLTTGHTKWQFTNPYGLSGDDCVTNSKYDTEDYVDSLGGSQCSKVDESILETPSDIYVDRISSQLVDQYKKSLFVAPLTISNDLVFIPSMTGELWIFRISDGTQIDTLYCHTQYDAENDGYIRPGFTAGATVVGNRVIIYCGAGIYGPTVATSGDYIYSYALPEDEDSDSNNSTSS